MNRFAYGLYLGMIATAAFGVVGCKRLVHSKAKDACTLLTDAEIESAMKLKVTSHKGEDNSCEWVLGSGAQTGTVGLMKSSKGAEAVLNSTLGEGTPVVGVGDSAKWLGGMMPILVVHTKGEIYRLSVMSPPLMTPESASTKTVVVDRRQTGPGTTLEKDAVSFDWPQLQSGAVVLAKAFIARL
jgi:hypothetical protein